MQTSIMNNLTVVKIHLIVIATFNMFHYFCIQISRSETELGSVTDTSSQVRG